MILEMEAVHLAQLPSAAQKLPLSPSATTVSTSAVSSMHPWVPELLELLSAMEVRGVLEEVPKDVVVSIQVRRRGTEMRNEVVCLENFQSYIYLP